jgi:hypothetical protein
VTNSLDACSRLSTKGLAENTVIIHLRKRPFPRRTSALLEDDDV